MKIHLTEKSGIHILSIQGDLDSKQFAVVKAGISKLLRDGKNRMVLDLSQIGKLDTEAVQGLVALNVVARELSGDILLSGLEAPLRQVVENLGKPSLLTCYPSLDAALDVFQRLSPEKEEIEADEEVSSGDIAVDFQKKNEEIKKLRAELKQKEEGELGRLREEVARLGTEKKIWEERIHAWIAEKRQPPTEQAALDKVRILEDKVIELQTQLEDLLMKAQKPS